MERVNVAKWIESRKRWQINVQSNGVRKTFTSSKPGRTGQREAQAKADRWLAGNSVTASTKVSDVYPRFIEAKKETTGYSNFVTLETRWRVHIEPVIGTRSLLKLSAGDLQDVIDAAAAEGMAKKSLQNIRGDLSAFCKWARKHQYIVLDADDVEIPHSAKSKQRAILQPWEVQILFKESTTTYRNRKTEEPDPFINAYRLAVLTGLRPGEIIGLDWKDCSAGQINLHRSINAYGETTTGKNENAQRPVYLSEPAKAVLMAQAQLTGHKGSVFRIPSRTVFYDRWMRYQAVHGIGPVSLYELRHTFVSLAANLPEAQLKKLVGHSKSMDTYGIYAHSVSGEDEAIRNNLTAIFQELVKLKE